MASFLFLAGLKNFAWFAHCTGIPSLAEVLSLSGRWRGEVLHRPPPTGYKPATAHGGEYDLTIRE